MTEILSYTAWVCAGFNVYMAILIYKRFRDLDRSYRLYNQQCEVLRSLENQAMNVATLGIYAFLKGSEQDKYNFMFELQDYNRNLEKSRKEFV